MAYSLSSIANRLGLELQGPDKEVTGVNTLDKAGPDEISFLANPKYASLLSQCRAGAVIIDPANADKVETALVSGNPYLAFARVVELFAEPQGSFEGVSDSAFIHPQADVREGATIYPFVYVGPRTIVESGAVVFSGCSLGEDCEVGKDSILYPNVTLMAGTRVGKRVLIHAGTVLGSDGFGFAPGESGLQKIPQIGCVVVEDDVEIGANTTVDRAALGETRIGKGTKIDNLVQVGHNVEVGENSILVAQAGISGSTKLGRRVTLAGQAGIAGHLELGDDVVVGPQCGVAQSISPGTTVGGHPAVERGTYLRILTLMPKLPTMAKRILLLEKELAALKKAVAGEEHDE